MHSALQTPVTPLHSRKAKARASAASSTQIKDLMQGSCFLFLETARLAVSTILIVLGLPLFVFLFLMGWDLGLLFTQLGNLAVHYHSAEPGQRLLFSSDLKTTFIAATGALLLVRMPRFFRTLAEAFPEKSDGERGK